MAVAVALSPKSQRREASTLPLSKLLVSAKVQSTEVHVAVKLACGAGPLGAAVTLTDCVFVLVSPARSLTVSAML